MPSPVSAGLALTLEHRICKQLSLPNLLTWRGEGRRRGRGQVKLKRHEWTAAVPQASCQGWGSWAKVTLSIREKQTWLPSAKMFLMCYFRFCRHHRYWISGVESADVIAHPSGHWSQFMSAFYEKTGAQREATADALTAAGANRRIQGISKATWMTACLTCYRSL